MPIKQPKLPVLIGKLLLVLLVALIIGNLLFYTVGFAFDRDDVNLVSSINQCEEAYRERDFAALLDRLNLYDLYDPEFDLYWEVAEGYDQMVACRQWLAAAKAGVDGSEQKAQAILEQLRSWAETPQFPQNKKILQGFLQQASAPWDTN